MIGEFEYDTDAVEIQPGDLVVIYSDGITEAFNEADDDYGEDRLLKLLKANANLNVGQLMDIIIGDVRKFMGSAPQSDDMSLLIVKREIS